MAMRLITPFCAASALFAALVADGALPDSWAQVKSRPSQSAAAEGKTPLPQPPAEPAPQKAD